MVVMVDTVVFVIVPVILYLHLPKLHCVLSKLGGLCLDWDLDCCMTYTADLFWLRLPGQGQGFLQNLA